MTSEDMMIHLRRIVGVFMEQRNLAVQASAKEGRREKASAYNLGKSDAYGRFIEEIAQTFNIDPWACENEHRAKTTKGDTNYANR